jgi:hypothetical protein
MRDWLKPWAPAEFLNQYDDAKVVPLVLTMLMPLFRMGKLDEAVKVVMEHLRGVPDSELDAVETKVQRYLTCFCEALM